MKKYFAYIRVSHPKQAERGSSLQEQRAAIEEFARRHGLTISEFFEEQETAAVRGRRAFGTMFSALRASRADGVIIHKIDRSARNLRDWADLGELIDRGVEVHFANESLDLRSRGGRLSADIQAVVAADFIRNLREEVRKGFFGRLRQGLYPLPAPLGYRDHGRGLPKEPDPLTAPLVSLAFELYATGTYSLDSLLEELARRGLRSRWGGALSRNGLSVLLNNPFYFGLIRIKKTGQAFAGVHEPLVSKALYERVQDVLQGRTPNRQKRHRFLLQRLLKCARCHRSLPGELQKGRVYYRCQTRTCPTTCHREDRVEERIGEELRRIEFTETEKADLLTAAAQLRETWVDRRDELLKAASLQTAKINERLTRLSAPTAIFGSG